MLTFVLKTKWYELFRSGEKKVEYREVKPYWIRRLKKAVDEPLFDEFFEDYEIGDALHVFQSPIDCILQKGYSKERLSAKISNIEIMNGKNTDLQVDKLVYAITLFDVKEL